MKDNNSFVYYRTLRDVRWEIYSLLNFILCSTDWCGSLFCEFRCLLRLSSWGEGRPSHIVVLALHKTGRRSADLSANNSRYFNREYISNNNKINSGKRQIDGDK